MFSQKFIVQVLLLNEKLIAMQPRTTKLLSHHLMKYIFIERPICMVIGSSVWNVAFANINSNEVGSDIVIGQAVYNRRAITNAWSSESMEARL